MSLFTRHAPAPTETAILDDAPAQDEHGTHTLHHNGDSPTPTFEALGVSHDLTKTLAEAGIERPFPIQTLAIPDALAGQDICGMAQTGSGKTLAFGLPMIERTTTARPRRPHSLVLAPTRELANQIADELTPLAAARGLWLTSIYGGVSMSRQVRALQMGVDIVVATPGSAQRPPRTGPAITRRCLVRRRGRGRPDGGYGLPAAGGAHPEADRG